eukprot:CAMPEP_0184440866 /NCGR_PEP_ID=MMETSP0738-20130409/755794_1 /TAXON_ID=385413 /ORGANISM="Thalassiosira miniscula, Strain CCMP1093" /LENGTH=111 /DNA_ID=CAMNT_0026808781 /DNA_START=338 /DNA_END=673 /DNA_ORIENTATION=-
MMQGNKGCGFGTPPADQWPFTPTNEAKRGNPQCAAKKARAGTPPADQWPFTPTNEAKRGNPQCAAKKARAKMPVSTGPVTNLGDSNWTAHSTTSTQQQRVTQIKGTPNNKG